MTAFIPQTTFRHNKTSGEETSEESPSSGLQFGEILRCTQDWLGNSKFCNFSLTDFLRIPFSDLTLLVHSKTNPHESFCKNSCFNFCLCCSNPGTEDWISDGRLHQRKVVF